MEEQSEDSESPSDDSQLVIAETSKRKRKRKAKLKETFVSDDNAKKLDQTIEETISKCKNLTSDVAKTLLCKLVKNDHLLALALLKAEEEEDLNNSQALDSDNDCEVRSDDMQEDVDFTMTPKLTRLKAKQLNKVLPIPGPLITADPDEEVVKLIQEDLQEDDDGDSEYQPELDATNTTYSDIDSQPSTPGSALLQNEEFESPSKNDGFKVPRTPLSIEEQENIARRTRSKLCLQTTSIETLESNFVPPDIYEFPDLYEFDHKNEDNEWKEFLNEFMMPLPRNVDEDDETDSDYVATDPVPVDKAEFRIGRVSKRELNQLISELLEDSCSLFDPEPSTSKKHDTLSKPAKKQKFSPGKKQSSKANTKLSASNELNTPPHVLDKSVENLDSQFDMFNNSNNMYYSPIQLQTPQRRDLTPQSLMQSPILGLPALTVIPSPSTLFQSPTLPIQTHTQSQNIEKEEAPCNIPFISTLEMPSILVFNQNRLELRSLSDTTGNFNPQIVLNQAHFSNGIYTLPEYQSVVLQIPTMEILQSNGFNQAPIKLFNQNDAQEQAPNEDVVEENLTDDTKCQLKKRQKKLPFEYLNDQKPPEVVITESKNGFTQQQFQNFEQQLRMHAQMLSQNFLQTYAHPKWWTSAEPLKDKLLELREKSEGKITRGTLNHISNCVKLCSDWKGELAENNANNQQYIHFLHNQMEEDEVALKEKRRFKSTLHHRLQRILLESKAIIYHSLLPQTAFRSVNFSRVDSPLSEISLLALALEHTHDKLYNELNSLNPVKIREPKLSSIVSSIKRDFGSFRTKGSLMHLIEFYRVHEQMNPIKYYYLNKKAPGVTHKIENVEIDDAKPPTELEDHHLPGIFKDLWQHLKAEKLNHVQSEIITENVAESAVKYSQGGEEIGKNLNNSNNSQQIEQVSTEAQKLCVNYIINEDTILQLRTPTKILNDSAVDRARVKNWQNSPDEKRKNLTSILKKVSSHNTSRKKSVNFLLPKSSSITEKFITHESVIILSIQKLHTEYSRNLHRKNDLHPLIVETFVSARSFDIYWRLVHYKIMLSNKKQKAEETKPSTSNGSETFVKPKKPITSEEYSKRINRKLDENRSLILQNTRSTCPIDKDCSYAYNYFERVRNTLLDVGDEALLQEFINTLKTFNPETESVPELYYKLESLFLPNYADLLDLFLTFLLPEHAAEIGKFCEHFLLTNMTNLIQKLNIFFQNQPSHMKKIYACLNELSNDQEITTERLKAKLLPMLKGNQLLISWFLELFDRPPTDNAIAPDEYETLYWKKNANDGEFCDDGYEEILSQDLIECDNSQLMCGVRYINGKIMYRCKTLIPAKISFLASEQTGEEKNPKPDDLFPLCVHEIRKHVQFLDMKKSNEEEAAAAGGVVKKKKTNKKFKICDTQTHHAHAVRMNSVHARNGEKLSDALQLLEQNAQNFNGDSPKKHSNKGNKKATSPKKSPVIKEAHNASKKAKMSVENGNEQQSKKQKLEVNEDSAKNNKEIEDMKPSTSTGFHSTVVEVAVKKEPIAWTREEDKEILVEINNGISKDEIVDILSKSFTNRTTDEIGERYEFLYNFVKCLKLKNNDC